MLQKLLDEMNASADFLGLELSELVVRQWGERRGATGSCRINGVFAHMPKFREDDNFRMLCVNFLVNIILT